MSSSRKNNHAAPPRKDELEISVFGPGVGECIVLHLGGNEWMVVDSCLDKTSRQPIAIAYLESLGVKPQQVKLFVVTHWHDDHMKGAGELFSNCTNAEVVFSLALRNSEFQTLLGACRTAFMNQSGLEEMHKVLGVVQERGKGKAQAKGPRWALADTTLYKNNSTTVTAMSPSNATVTLALNQFAELIPQEGAPKRRLVAQKPNATSVVFASARSRISSSFRIIASLDVGLL